MGLLPYRWGRTWLTIAAVAFCLRLCPAQESFAQETFEILDSRSHTFTNVNVISKTDTDVFITHDGGIANVKIRDLDAGVQEQLGYDPTGDAPRRSFVSDPRLVEMQEKMAGEVIAGLSKLAGPLLIAIGVGLFLLYLFECYCFMLICKKAGHEPGLSVWIPAIQIFPLLKAAGMSAWWVLLGLIPFGAVLLHLIWCFKIAAARGKSWVVGLLLWLPVTNIFAFLYLAFSNGVEQTAAPSAGPRVSLSYQQ